MMVAQAIAPALPYPTSSRILVFEDDGKWDDYIKWFMRSDEAIARLHRCTITLPVDDDDDVCVSCSAWCRLAEMFLKDHPNCIFIYT